MKIRSKKVDLSMLKRLAYILVAGGLMAGGIETYLSLHHLFVTGLNPFLGTVFLILALLLAIPLIIWAMKKLRMSTWELFAAGTMCWLYFTIAWGSILNRSTLDLHLHDTFFVIARLPLTEFLLGIMVVFTWTYYLLEKFGYVNWWLGRLHFWVTFLGLVYFVWPDHHEGLAGMPRRYIDYSGWMDLDHFGRINETNTIVLLATLIMQIVFVGMVVYYTTRKFFVGTNN